MKSKKKKTWLWPLNHVSALQTGQTPKILQISDLYETLEHVTHQIFAIIPLLCVAQPYKTQQT